MNLHIAAGQMKRKILILSPLILLCLLAPAGASDFIQGYFPSRPTDSRALGLSAGVFEKYELHGENNALYAFVVLRDDIEHRERRFYLAADTTLNGVPLRCTYKGPTTTYSTVISQMQLCMVLPPSLVPGRTRLAVLSWPSQLFIGQTVDASDTLATITSEK